MTLATDFSDEYRADMARRSWPGRTLLDHLDDAVAGRPDALALVGYTHADDGRRALTYGELAEQVDRVAAGLLDLGVRAGQVVSMQLPNWWQMPALSLACLRVGAVTNALMPIFRSRELEFMLGLAGPPCSWCPRSSPASTTPGWRTSWRRGSRRWSTS